MYMYSMCLCYFLHQQLINCFPLLCALLAAAVVPADPAAPKPVGPTMQPAVGVPLESRQEWHRNLEAAILHHSATLAKFPAVSVVDMHGKVSVVNTYSELHLYCMYMHTYQGCSFEKLIHRIHLRPPTFWKCSVCPPYVATFSVFSTAYVVVVLYTCILITCKHRFIHVYIHVRIYVTL